MVSVVKLSECDGDNRYSQIEEEGMRLLMDVGSVEC